MIGCRKTEMAALMRHDEEAMLMPSQNSILSGMRTDWIDTPEDRADVMAIVKGGLK